MLFVQHALLAASCHWPPTTSSSLNVVLLARSIASCILFRPCLTGDICTVAFSCQGRTLSSYVADDMRSRFRDDLQQMTAVQQEATVQQEAPPPSSFPFKPTKLTVFASSQSTLY